MYMYFNNKNKINGNFSLHRTNIKSLNSLSDKEPKDFSNNAENVLYCEQNGSL